MKYKTKNQGFSLIEVMIAVLVLGVGILAVTKLQSTLMRSGSDANQRTIATSLAQKKIDDLRAFTKRNNSEYETWAEIIALSNNLQKTEVAYSHISDNTGGLIRMATLVEPIPIGSTDYSLKWTVVDYWNIPGLLEPTTTQPASASDTPDFKKVTVTVEWSNEDPVNTPSISLDTLIAAYAPALTDLSNNSQNGGEPPKASYTPGIAPDIVYTSLGEGDRRESTAPIVSVSQNKQYVQYDFSIITYDTDKKILKQEDLRQINCTCEQQSTDTDTDTYLPATIELAKDDTIFVNKFDVVDFKGPAGKKWGAPVTTGQYGQQSSNCDICCRDHHDKTGAEPDELFDPFRPSGDYMDGGDHNHYFPDNTGTLQLANTVGELYLEACLLTKVDGIFRVAQDLNLLTVKTMPESYLLGDGFTKYQDYKTDYLLAYAGELVANNSLYPAQDLGPVGTDGTIKFSLNSEVSLLDEPDLVYPALSVNETVSLRAKTLYARYIPAEVFSKLKDTIELSPTWSGIANLLPFYDPDGTLIAETNDDTSAWGTSRPSQVDIDQSGLLTAIASTAGNLYSDEIPDPDGKASVEATRSDSTTGFTNTPQIDPNDASYLTSDKMLVVVDGNSSPTVVNVTFTVTVANAIVNDKSVSILGQNGALCAAQSGQNKHVHICSFANGTGNLAISNYNGSSANVNDTTVINHKVCLASSEPTISLANDGNETETSSITYLDLTDDTEDKVIHIILEGSNCP